VDSKLFGRMTDGTPIELYRLKSERIEVQCMAYGAGIVSLRVPDRSGRWEDVVLGFDELDSYAQDHRSKSPSFLGSTVGRYANRIAGARFSLEGKEYTLAKNNGENSLHGGPGGFYNVIWKAEEIENGVAFHYLSKDGDEGFPGKLTSTVRYTLNEADLQIEYFASTDRTTVVNLTNHSYFNLAGAGRGPILSHRLKLCASRFTPTDAGMIPTGELRSVAGTPLDFRDATAIGKRIDASEQQLRLAQGYDHNFVLDDSSGNLKLAAELHHPLSGRVLETWTTEPGIQFYSGNYLNGTLRGKGGVRYGKYSGLCLETQHFPDSPNQPGFPSTVLKAGETFHSLTIYRFSTR
jgi:aldose 1-epimerase